MNKNDSLPFTGAHFAIYIQARKTSYPLRTSKSTMRACYSLVIAATSLLIASDAAISAAMDSALVSPHPIGAAQTAVNTQRLLRRHENMEAYDGDDDDDIDDDDGYEERGKPPFATARLEKALNNNRTLAKLLKQWDDDGYSLERVARNVEVDMNGPLDQHFMSLVTGFKPYQNGWRPQ
ncbi:unnamed protein product [Phytophthora lilii]|uniref:RxLR effector protein n=1 Tax=Phytophthora lilii TaxID=2077276 RepID=A0A9W6WQF5_9STRA|nr:unnamed protein product [Phytophthora lilii]